MNDGIITRQMYDSARRGLSACLSCRERVRQYEQLGYPSPDIIAAIDEHQPRFEAVIEAWGQQQAGPGRDTTGR